MKKKPVLLGKKKEQLDLILGELSKSVPAVAQAIAWQKQGERRYKRKKDRHAALMALLSLPEVYHRLSPMHRAWIAKDM